MAPQFAIEIEAEREVPPTETSPQRRAGGWRLHPEPRIGLNLGSDEELLMVENKTEVSWFVYHNYHRLSIIDAGELLVFHVYKHGSLSVRPCDEGDAAEYLVLSLTYDVNYVYIYRRQMNKELEIYDMRAA